MTRRPLRRFALALTLLVLAPAADAKEESKLQILLLPPGSDVGHGLAKGRGPIGDVRSFLQGDSARLQLRVRGLAPGIEHTLLALEDAMGTDPVELARFTTGTNGQFNDSFDLSKGDSVEAPVDPRGRYLVVNDGSEDVLAGWLYGPVELDGPKTKLKELTRLAPDETQDPTGTTDARYDKQPNGRGSLVISMRGVPAGDYDVYVDGVVVLETLTPNPGGSARATFLTHPSNGNGGGSKGHAKRGFLGFDPRRKLIELKQGDQVYFSGPMLAQIEGLNACTGDPIPLTDVSPPGVSAALEVGADCETALVITATGIEAGVWAVLVDAEDRGDLTVADDGMGGTTGSVRFDPTPDAMAGELLLDFPVTSASSVELVLQQP